MSDPQTPKELDAIVDRILAYKAKPKLKSEISGLKKKSSFTPPAQDSHKSKNQKQHD